VTTLFQIQKKQGDASPVLPYGTLAHWILWVGWLSISLRFVDFTTLSKLLVGGFHQPPPVHQTFNWDLYCFHLVAKAFCYHPLANSTPYNHSNIDSDEVMYYAEGEFMSRKGIDRGSFTIHMRRFATLALFILVQ